MNKGLHLKAKRIDLETGTINIVVMNEYQALEEGINAGDRVRIEVGNHKINALVDFAETIVEEGEIGLFEEIYRRYKIKAGTFVEVFQVPNPLSVDYIRKKIDGQQLNREEIYEIIKDVVASKLSEIELSAFVTACQILNLTEEETYYLTKAVVETGDTLHLKNKIIADKHSLGGVAGNRTTMIVVPVLASLGVTIPKTSSRSITSPAGTADTMEVLADVEFSAKELEEIVKKTGGAIAFGGTVNLAGADDKLIKVRHPLHLDPVGLMLASILAKKKAVGATHVLIDIPVGEEAKIKNIAEAESLGKLFTDLGKKLDMHVECIITDGSMPIGRGIGPLLEARDVLMVLKQHPNRSMDLEKKALKLCEIILEMIGYAKIGDGYAMALNALKNGKADEKMKEIIKAQGGNPKININDLKVEGMSYLVRTDKEGAVKKISNRAVINIARAAGAPAVKDSGVYLVKNIGERVAKGDILFAIYSKNKEKLGRCIEMADKNNPYSIR